ncbi:MAG: hypothetical protein D6682_04470 [Zetaproteobacteria bacterium]|nr:MAG: hypothetical protein D6682_04470 [Zetaproteobacteria bacterium]
MNATALHPVQGLFRSLRWSVPLLLAAAIIFSALAFVRYFNAYEAPGDHWAPASPIVHENARFTTRMGQPGDYRITVEKRSSKWPLFFVEYQPPGPIVEAIVHSDDGVIRLDQRFADEGRYRIRVAPVTGAGHGETVDFTVQTPLFKYANDLFLAALLLAAGFVSGRRLRQLAASMALLLAAALTTGPEPAMAHGGHHHETMTATSAGGRDAQQWRLSWLHGAPHGPANRQPLDFSLRLDGPGVVDGPIPYRLEIIHSETHFPVLTISGVSRDGTIPLRYSPPDGTDYRVVLSAVAGGALRHLSLPASAEAIPPTVARSIESFAILMVPVLIGMAWGWRQGGGAKPSM